LGPHFCRRLFWRQAFRWQRRQAARVGGRRYDYHV
jgi:hypothetical protein